MTVIDRHHFAVAPDEQVTVVVDERGTAFAVGFAINQASGAMVDGKPLTFKVTRNPTFLALTAVFSGDTGGSYDVIISGSGGGRSDDRLEQTGGSKIDIHEYEFRIAGVTP